MFSSGGARSKPIVPDLADTQVPSAAGFLPFGHVTAGLPFVPPVIWLLLPVVGLDAAIAPAGNARASASASINLVIGKPRCV